MNKLFKVGGLTVLNFAITYLVNMLMARWLGPIHYGDCATGIAVIMILATVADMGMEKLALKNVPVYADQGQWGLYSGFLRTGWRMIAVIGLILVLVLWAAHGIYYSFSSREQHATLIYAIIFSPLLALRIFSLEVLSANMALVSAVLIKTVVRPMIFLGYMVLANRIFQHLDAVKVFWCFGLTALTTFIIAMVMVRRTTPDLARGSMPVYEVRQWLALSTPFMLNALVLLASRRAGLLTLEALSPHEAQVGILAGVTIIASFINMFIPITNSFFLPQMSSHLKKNNTVEVNKLLGQRLLFLGLICLAFLVAILFFGREILNTFHQDFSAGYELLAVYGLGASIMTLLSICPWLLQFLGRNRLVVNMNLTVLVSAVGLCIVLVPYYHGLGAVLGYFIPSILAMIVQIFILAREYRIWVVGPPLIGKV